MGVKRQPLYELGHIIGPDVAASIDRALDRAAEALLTVQGLDAILSGDLGLSGSGPQPESDRGGKRPPLSRRAPRSLDQVVERLDRLLSDVEACAARTEFGAFTEIEDELTEFLETVMADLVRLRASTLDRELLDLHAEARARLDEIQNVVFADSREDGA